MVWISCFVFPLVIFFQSIGYIKDFLKLYFRGYRIVHKDDINPPPKETKEPSKDEKDKISEAPVEPLPSTSDQWSVDSAQEYISSSFYI